MNTHTNGILTPHTRTTPDAHDERVQAILARLDHAAVPDCKYPDAQGEYWALCPFHDDKKPANFSFTRGQMGSTNALPAAPRATPRSSPPRSGWRRTPSMPAPASLFVLIARPVILTCARGAPGRISAR